MFIEINKNTSRTIIKKNNNNNNNNNKKPHTQTGVQILTFRKRLDTFQTHSNTQ